jgi:hypothetical protein
MFWTLKRAVYSAAIPTNFEKKPHDVNMVAPINSLYVGKKIYPLINIEL